MNAEEARRRSQEVRDAQRVTAQEEYRRRQDEYERIVNQQADEWYKRVKIVIGIAVENGRPCTYWSQTANADVDWAVAQKLRKEGYRVMQDWWSGDEENDSEYRFHVYW